MLSIYKSERFQTEFADWKKQTESITDLKFKSEVEKLLANLESSVKKLDFQITEAIINKQMKSFDNEGKDAIQQLRRAISKKLLDWNQANNIKEHQSL